MGAIIGGLMQIPATIDETGAEAQANSQQYDREYRQANAALQGAYEKGSYEQGKLRILGAQTVAKQKVAYANSGVDATSGTAAAVQADTATLNEHDAQTAKINAAREAWGYKETEKQAGQEYSTRRGNIDRKFTYGTLGGLTKYASGIAGMYGGGGE